MKSNKEGGKNEEKKDHNRTSYSELEDCDTVTKPNKRDERRASQSNKDLWMFRKSKANKVEKNDPERFTGEGVNFKAKIIGIENVFNARGNRMCQDALQKLKATAKTSGEHKHRVVLNISLHGIRIKDEKTGELLHHHSVHKISFISQDVSDSRAFGYVFGCPQTGHQFFGIKTEKASSQVVCALRDLFHLLHGALELRKKEITQALEQQNEEENLNHVNGKKDEEMNGCSFNSAQTPDSVNASEPVYSELVALNGSSGLSKSDSTPTSENPTGFGCTVDNLLDLQFEMESLQQGIKQMDNSIASAGNMGFAVSFSEDNTSMSSGCSFPTTPRKLNRVPCVYNETLSVSSRSSSTSECMASSQDGIADNLVGCRNNTITSQTPEPPAPNVTEDRYAVFYEIDDLPSVFDNPIFVSNSVPKESEPLPEKSMNELEEYEDDDDNMLMNDTITEDGKSDATVFAKLDPLGDQPYIHKQNFFHDLKNPPKKVLKDLISNNCDTENAFEQNVLASTSLNGVGDSSVTEEKFTNPFISLQQAPPKLPPKRAVTVALLPLGNADKSQSDLEEIDENIGWTAKNPFNPFAAPDSFPDLPPPNSPPPPPPPPRMMRDSTETSLPTSPPPPRPPSRTSAVPTPPRPRRKVSLGSTNGTWFSFDQETLNSSAQSSWCNPSLSPPLPIPLRKLPSSKYELPTQKSVSASNSPALSKRFANHSSMSEEESSTGSRSRSPSARLLTRHMSVTQEAWESGSSKSDDFVAVFPPFSEDKEAASIDCTEVNQILNCSPPVPPKSTKISRPRPSPSRKMLAAHSNSSSGSTFSSSENTSGSSRHTPLSTSSQHCSSFERSKNSCFGFDVPSFSSDSQADDMPYTFNGEVSVESTSSVTSVEEKPSPLSPDSIFRRKSDPFSDDFFLSLPKKSFEMKAVDDGVTEEQCTNGLHEGFRNEKEPIYLPLETDTV